MKTTIGTILLVLGIGFIVLTLPDVIRYMLHEDSYLGDSRIGMALGAMFVASGRFLGGGQTELTA